MAQRPIFTVCEARPYFAERMTEFVFYPGFSEEQKRRSVRSLHETYARSVPEARILEISGRSELMLGQALSAFNLRVTLKDGRKTTLESAFQAGKVFDRGGPYVDLLFAPSRIAKKDERLKNSGSIVEFVFDGESFPTEPQTFFYDWLYVNALAKDERLSKELIEYDAFTDIEFNPARSLNCQARSAAVFVSLARAGKLAEALSSKESFLKTVYGTEQSAGVQLSLL